MPLLNVGSLPIPSPFSDWLQLEIVSCSSDSMGNEAILSITTSGKVHLCGRFSYQEVKPEGEPPRELDPLHHVFTITTAAQEGLLIDSPADDNQKAIRLLICLLTPKKDGEHVIVSLFALGVPGTALRIDFVDGPDGLNYIVQTA